MFNKHLFKVIVGFCGMILVGLISLVWLDSMKENQVNAVGVQEKCGSQPC